MNNLFRMEFSANLRNVSFARTTVATFLFDLDLTLNVINEIKTIVSEAVTNAIYHGYECDDSQLVGLIVTYEDNLLTIVVKDTGKGIPDIEKDKEPLFSTKKNEERAGLGFTIMEIFSDELEVKSAINEGTTVICKKRLEI